MYVCVRVMLHMWFHYHIKNFRTVAMRGVAVQCIEFDLPKLNALISNRRGVDVSRHNIFHFMDHRHHYRNYHTQKSVHFTQSGLLFTCSDISSSLATLIPHHLLFLWLVTYLSALISCIVYVNTIHSILTLFIIR